MNTLIGMALGGLAGVGFAQAFAAAVEGRAWLPWLLLGLIASAALAGLLHRIRTSGP